MERPVEQPLGDLGWALDVAAGAGALQLARELDRVVHVLENMRADRVGERAVAKGQMVRVGYHERSIDHQIAAALAVIPVEKAIEEHIRTGIWVVAAADFED